MKKYNWIFVFVFLFAVVGIQSAQTTETDPVYEKIVSDVGPIQGTLSNFMENILVGSAQLLEFKKGILDFNGNGVLDLADLTLAQRAESGLTTWTSLVAQRDNPLPGVLGQGATSNTLFDIVRGVSQVTLTDNQKKLLDLNGDGNLTSTDATIAYNAEKGTLIWLSLINTRDGNRLQREIFGGNTSLSKAILESLLVPPLRTLTAEQQRLLNFDGTGGLTTADAFIAGRAEIGSLRWVDVIKYRDSIIGTPPPVTPPSITLFAAKDPNPDNRSVTIVWAASAATDASIDVICTPGSISFTTDKGNYPNCEKGGVWSWSGQTSGSVILTPQGNTNSITLPFKLTLIKNGYPTGQTQKIFVTFPASPIQNQTSPYVKVISPNGGESFNPGSSITIKWTSSGVPADSVASISLINESQNTAVPLTGSFISSDRLNVPLSGGSYSVNLPADIQPGTYKVLLTCLEARQNSNAYCNSSNPQDYSDGYITILSIPNNYTPLIDSIILKDDSLGLPNLSFAIQWKTKVPATVKATITCSPTVSLYNKEGNTTQTCSSTNPIVINYAGLQDNNAANFGQANTNYPVNVALTIQASYQPKTAPLVTETKSASFTYTPPDGDGKFYFLSAPSGGSSLKIGSTYEIKTPPSAIGGVTFYLYRYWTGKTPNSIGNLACIKNETSSCLWEVGKYYTNKSEPGSTPLSVGAGEGYYIGAVKSDGQSTASSPNIVSPSFTLTTAGGQETPPISTNPDIASLLKMIEELKKQIAILQGQVVTDNSLPNETTSFSYNWQNALYVGLRNNEDVRALQNALLLEKVYTGPVTGNFGPLTLAATRAFQEKYGITPVTGFVGELTRNKLNSLY